MNVFIDRSYNDNEYEKHAYYILKGYGNNWSKICGIVLHKISEIIKLCKMLHEVVLYTAIMF